MSETYVTYRVWDGCKAPINLEYNGRLIGQIVRESTIDRDALLALAEDVDGAADDSGGLEPLAGVFRYIARCIREACGVGGEMKEWTVCADKPTRAMERMHVGDVVRCRDCASIKPTTDGRHYCTRWSHIVPLDGYCWRGEAKSGEEAQEG